MWKAVFVWLLFHHKTERTNATFWRRGTKQRVSTDQRPWSWHWLPGWQRMLWKLGSGLVATLMLYVEIFYPAVLNAVALLMLAAGVALGFRWAWKRWKTRTHVRQVVEPFHDALCCILPDDAPWHWQTWLDVPRDYRDEGTAGTRIDLPSGRAWPADVKAAMTEAASQKLGIADLQVQWQLAGDSPFVVFKPVPQAPRSVGLGDVEDAIRTAADTAPVIGMAKFRKLVTLDLEDDSPHILVSAGSGGGKSVLAKILIAQFLARGARVVIMDRKRISHRWAKDLPEVEYYRDTEQIHDALIRLAMEGDRRNLLTDDDENPDLGGRIVLVFEEMNATMGKLTNYWAANRGKDDPKRSPALEALGDLVNMGRQVQMHVVAIGQRIETRTLGGGDVRESFGIRCLSRYTVQTWKMLCADVWPMPRKSNVRGRWQIVAAGEATETQVAFLTDREAQTLARSSITCPVAEQAATGIGTGVGTETVSLRDHFGGDYDKWRKRMHRDPSAPSPASVATNGADLYRRVDLIDWCCEWDAAHLPEPIKESA